MYIIMCKKLYRQFLVNYTVRQQIFFEVWLVISCRLCYAEYPVPNWLITSGF